MSEKKKDVFEMSLNNRVENFVQIELQRRQFGNRYKKTPQPGEPVGDYQSIGLADYQANKPVWATVRSMEQGSGETNLIGSAMNFFDDADGKGATYRSPVNNFTHNYDIGQSQYLSEYGSGKNLRPKPGLRNISVNQLGNGLYSEITINFKCFTKLQLNTMSRQYFVIGKKFLIMFGYGSIGSDKSGEESDKRKIINLINPATDSPFVEKGSNSIESEVAAFSQGTIYAKIGRVQSFDINFNGDDATFDVTTVFVTEGSLEGYAPQKDAKISSAVQEIFAPPPEPQGRKELEYKDDERDKYEKYTDFIFALRGYSNTKNFILPTQNSLYTIGQELEVEYQEIIMYEIDDTEDVEEVSGEETTFSSGSTASQRVEEREVLPGFTRVSPTQAERAVVYKEDEESLDSLLSSECDTIFDGKGETNFDFDMSVNGPEQLAFGIKNKKGKGNKVLDQSYIPWGVCEWIINNGIHIKKEGEKPEVVFQKYSQFVPPEKVFFVPLKETSVEVEEPVPEDAPPGTQPNTVTQIVYSDNPEAMELKYELPGHHLNYIRSVIYPKVSSPPVEGDDSTPDPTQLKTMAMVKTSGDEILEGSKMVSTGVNLPTHVFSADPGVCVITDTIPSEESIEPKFKIHELNDSYKFYIENEDGTRTSTGYIRNILINADWFFEKLIGNEGLRNNEDVGVGDFVRALFTDISNALGGAVTFRVEVGQTDGNSIRVVDRETNSPVFSKTELDTAKDDYREIEFSVNGTSDKTGIFRIYNKIFPINNFGQDSIVREMNFSMDLDGDISNHFFWNKTSDQGKFSDINTQIVEQKKLIQTYEASQQPVPPKEAKKLDGLLKQRKDNTGKVRTYLTEYLKSAARTYSKLVPDNKGEVAFQSTKNILNTKLIKILTSSDLSNKEIITKPFNVPTLPLQVEVTIDGIAGIKMYDAFYLSYLPAMYDDGFFKVTGITHSVEGTDWMTKLNLLYVPSDYKQKEIESGT